MFAVLDCLNKHCSNARNAVLINTITEYDYIGKSFFICYGSLPAFVFFFITVGFGMYLVVVFSVTECHKS